MEILKIKYLRLTLVLILFLLLINCSKNPTNGNNSIEWVATSGPIGGNPPIRSIIENDSGILFLSSPLYAGLMKSIDGGNSWFHINNEKLIIRGHGLTIDESNNLFIRNDQIFWSKDDGESWKIIQYPSSINGQYIHSWFVNNNGHVFITDDNGIYRSTNKGKKWKNVSSDRIRIKYCTPTGVLYGVRDDALCVSDDNGLTWNYSHIYDGVGYVNFITNDSSGNTFIGSDRGLYRLYNNDAIWTRVLSTNVRDIDIQADNSILVMSYSNGLYKSSDDGDTWTHFNNKDGFFSTYTLLISKNNQVYIGADSGLFVFNENDATFNKVSLPTTSVSEFAINGSDIYAGTSKSGVFRLSSYDNTWHPLHNTGKSEVRSLVTDNGVIYAGTLGAGIFASNSNGNDWTRVNFDGNYIMDMYMDIENNIHVVTIHDYAVKYSDSDQWNIIKHYRREYLNCIGGCSNGYLFMGVSNGDVYRSVDSGNTWEKIIHNQFYNGPWRIVVDSEDCIYCTCTKGIFKSDDYGETWEQIIDEEPIGFYIDDNDNVFIGTHYNLYISHDKGTTWKVITGDLSHPSYI